MRTRARARTTLPVSQALEALRKLKLEKKQEAKEMTLKLETLKSHKDAAQKLATDFSNGNAQVRARAYGCAGARRARTRLRITCLRMPHARGRLSQARRVANTRHDATQHTPHHAG
jgi:hypothetical protein